MDRRAFIGALAGGLLATPPALAQQPGRPYRIALLPDFGARWEPLLKLFVEGLRELGRIEGRDYVFYRSGVFYSGETTPALDRVTQPATQRPGEVRANERGVRPRGRRRGTSEAADRLTDP